jgi:hypothetical protein
MTSTDGRHDHPHPHPREVDGVPFVCKGTPPSPSSRFEGVAKKWSGVLPDKFVALVVELVSTTQLQSTIAALAAIPSRHTRSTHIGTARTLVHGGFTAAGYSDVADLPWALANHSGHNVVCTKPGVAGSTDTIIVCAHYDSRMATAGDATSPAPGADDNASGVAAMLEIARLVAALPLDATVRFVAFSGEEQGLLGSTVYAQSLHDAGENVRLVVNLDMIGFPPADGSITVERDLGNVVAGNDAASIAFGAVMAQAAVDYTDLPVKLGPIFASDYMPFESHGYVAIGAYEGDGNPNYHESSDLPATVDMAYLTKVTQMVLATLLNEALDVSDASGTAVDLYVRDSAADTGAQPSPVPHWESPDIWVRNGDPALGDDPELGHQPPINGVPNYLYVRVHNRGTAAVPTGTATLRAYRCDPGTGMIWPTHFTSLGTLTISDPIPAGGAVRVGPFIWTPQIVGHECLLAVASVAEDRSVADLTTVPLRHDLLVRFDNNVGQRNVAPQMAVPGGKVKFSLSMRGGPGSTENDWELDASAFPADTTVMIKLPRRVADHAAVTGFAISGSTQQKVALTLAGGVVGRLAGFPLGSDERANVEVVIDFSHQADHLGIYPLVATQYQDEAIAGRLTMQITALKDLDDFFFANPRSREIHTTQCPFWPALGPASKVPYEHLADAVARGYNGCAFCIPHANTG